MNVVIPIVIAVFAFAVFKQVLEHRENMELAKRGVQPKRGEEQQVEKKASWRGGLITAAVGAAILIGFLPLVISEPDASPALMGGLIPLFIGLAIMYSSKGETSNQNMYEVRDENVPNHKQHLLEETYDEDGILFERTADKIDIKDGR